MPFRGAVPVPTVAPRPLTTIFAAVLAAALVSVAVCGCTSIKPADADRWAAGARNETDAAHLITFESGGSGMTLYLPPLSENLSFWWPSNEPVTASVYTTDCGKVGSVRVGLGHELARIRTSGVDAVAYDGTEPRPSLAMISGGPLGWDCRSGWHVEVMNESAETYVVQAESLFSSVAVPTHSRATLSVGADGASFPDNLEVDVYSADCRHRATTNPTVERNVVQIDTAGVASVQPMDVYWMNASGMADRWLMEPKACPAPPIRT